MSDDYERPFIEDGSQFGISQATFAQMKPAEQRELMIQWFFEDFKDSANQTPWDGETKEYMYIWGGPYSASDQVWEKFGDFVPESFIAEIVDEVQSDGTTIGRLAQTPHSTTMAETKRTKSRLSRRRSRFTLMSRATATALAKNDKRVPRHSKRLKTFGGHYKHAARSA
jgi:hypothetical protein